MQFNVSWLAEVLMERPAGYPPAIEMTGRGSQTYITWKFKFLWMEREALFLMPSGLRLIIRWVINWVEYQNFWRIFFGFGRNQAIGRTVAVGHCVIKCAAPKSRRCPTGLDGHKPGDSQDSISGWLEE